MTSTTAGFQIGATRTDSRRVAPAKPVHHNTVFRAVLGGVLAAGGALIGVSWEELRSK
jgi:hypothetical protein